jgi:hypothetical protein
MTTQRMQVEDTTFLIDRLGADCAPLQYVRELTSNAIQAIQERQRQGWRGQGRIIWDVDWPLIPPLQAYKLRISDNGTGMTGPQIQRYINQLSSSGREQGLDKNFGLGAKIAGCVTNPAGMLYRSWVSGAGVVATLWKDPRAGYGLEQFEVSTGVFAHYANADESTKPEPIDDCGTSVTLFGSSREGEHTFMPPGSKNKWLIKYLNDRYFDVPGDIKIQVRNFQRTDHEGWPTSPEQGMGEAAGSQLRTIVGMRENLNRVKLDFGIVRLSNANAHWWLLPEDDVQQKDIWESRGHCAALFQGELYDFQRTQAARSRIREFGIVFGTNRVVLYLEPHADRVPIVSNTARSSLLVEGQPLPWDQWAAEFRHAIPEPLRAMMDEITSRAGESDHREAIKRRLREIRDLLRVTRYRPQPGGPVQIDGGLLGGEAPTSPAAPRSSGGRSGTHGGTAGNLYGALIRSGGVEGAPVTPRDDVPQINWIGLANGTREPDDLDDRAARYLQPQNLLQINTDFRVFTDLRRYCAAQYNPSGDENIESKIEDVVREWIEFQLVEAVIGVQALQGSQRWDSNTVKQALSEEALTAAVLPRYNMLKTINRALGARLGRRGPEE